MKDGFIKVAAVTPDIRVADCEYNAEQICKKMKEAAALIEKRWKQRSPKNMAQKKKNSEKRPNIRERHW